MERAGTAGEGEGVFWGGLVVCCKERKNRRTFRRRKRMRTQSIKEDLMCKYLSSLHICYRLTFIKKCLVFMQHVLLTCIEWDYKM